MQKNGDMMLLLAHLLNLNTEWRHAKLYVRTIIYSEAEQIAMNKKLKALISESRISAENDVIFNKDKINVAELMHRTSKNADIVFIGEAPGEQEALLGVACVGRAGKLLDNIVAAIELTRNDVYICNILKCRPPNNRDPLPSEVEKCEPYLIKQLHLISPKLIVLLGRSAACTMLNTKEPLKNLRNQIFTYAQIDLLVTYHPAALLRNPNFKKPAWEDFQLIRDKYLR
jgi:DNA polymerase